MAGKSESRVLETGLAPSNFHSSLYFSIRQGQNRKPYRIFSSKNLIGPVCPPGEISIDGGYMRDWEEKKRHGEVIVGKSILALPLYYRTLGQLVEASYPQATYPQGKW